MDIGMQQVILGEFRAEHGKILEPSNEDVSFVLSVNVVADRDDNPLIQIVLEHGKESTDLPPQFQLTQFHVIAFNSDVPVIYVNQGRVYALGTTAVEPVEAAPGYQIYAGELAQVRPYGLRGTYGWGFVVGGQAYALSNWHIFCPKGNDSTADIRVTLGAYEVATLAYFERLADTGNRWDLALARLDDPNMLVGAFRNCYDGNGDYGYPFDITQMLQTGEPHYTIGNDIPFSTFGQFTGIGNVSVRYHDGVDRVFWDQLIFDSPLGAGDSGSVAVRQVSNTVTGLFFAANSTVSYANWLFTRKWMRRGDFRTNRGSVLPSFVVSPPLYVSPG